MQPVVLINPNRMQPAVSPVALDYLAAALDEAGFDVEIVDLAFAPDPLTALRDRLGGLDALLVGVSFRNVDDCHGASRRFCLPEHRRIIHAVRQACPAPIVLGGVGFSVMPQAVMDFCGANLGIVGAGERAMVELARCVRDRRSAENIAGLIARYSDSKSITLPAPVPLDGLPLHRRTYVDNARYWREGGQVGFETKRGCPHACIYCAEAGSAPAGVLLRRPSSVVRELSCLLALGVRHLHTCDSEFNVPPEHGAAVCDAIRAAGLQRHIRWYAYCTPAGFTAELAARMAAAGCAGVNFGVDHTDTAMLRSLRRGFTGPQAIAALRAAKDAGMAVMADLLLGCPGETNDSLRRVIANMKRIDLDAVGVALGVRVFPGTELARRLKMRPERLLKPTFYLDPAVGSMDDAEALLAERIGGDPRFFFGTRTPSPESYNYNDNQVLVDAIAAGARGAYWHILSRLRRRRATVLSPQMKDPDRPGPGPQAT